jgi:hypothetical protein
MANQTKEKKDVSVYNQDDAKELNQPEADVSAYSQDDMEELEQQAKYEQTTLTKTLSKAPRGKCPPGQTPNPVTGVCE